VVKIYTKTGDAGETGLFDGSRVSKHSPRVEAYGDVDELNALLGLALAFIREDEALRTCLLTIQRDLFVVGAHLADPTARVESKRGDKARLSGEKVTQLEHWIDHFED
jgi:cob(I)alamin adenosyltransferase